MKAIAIASGGIDSAVMIHLLEKECYELHLLGINYGQTNKELDFLSDMAVKKCWNYTIINISAFKNEIIQNKNSIIISIAYGLAVTQQANQVCLAVHAGDRVKNDCRWEFIMAFNEMQKQAIKSDIELYAPFLTMCKSDVVSLGEDLNVPFQETWSCLFNGNKHCGTCISCIERQEAFLKANIMDSTDYEVKQCIA